ncbi:MAG: SH3 domain-containing protein, partial [Blastocatellia bacterium]
MLTPRPHWSPWLPFALLCLLAPAYGQTAPIVNRITTGANVRMRDTPQTGGGEIAKLSIGTVVEVLEQTATKEKIGATEDYWLRVATGDGKTGWLFGGLTIPFNAAQREATYLRIVTDRLKPEAKNFADELDLAGFLTRAIAEMRSPAAIAELELARLLVIGRAMSLAPADKLQQAPYAAAIKTWEKEMVYHEPAGQWLVDSARFWALEKK